MRVTASDEESAVAAATAGEADWSDSPGASCVVPGACVGSSDWLGELQIAPAAAAAVRPLLRENGIWSAASPPRPA